MGGTSFAGIGIEIPLTPPLRKGETKPSPPLCKAARPELAEGGRQRGFYRNCSPSRLLKIMRRRKVDEILVPYEDGVPLDPSVTIGDRIITAIELMVGKNLKQIAVVRNQRPVGMVRLEDAFRKIGLTKIETQARDPQ
jgi:hypothetical protein